MPYQPIHLHEGKFCLRTMTGDKEKELAYRFRYRVFCRALRWISPSAPGIDRDRYDDAAILLGVFEDPGELRAMVRILPPTGDFMLESDFAPLLAELPLCSVASDCSRTLRLFRSAYMAHLGGRAKRGSRSSFWSSALMSAGILEKNPIKGRPFGASRIKRIA